MKYQNSIIFFYSYFFVLTEEDDFVPASPGGSCRAQYCVLPNLIQNTVSLVSFFTDFFFLFKMQSRLYYFIYSFKSYTHVFTSHIWISCLAEFVLVSLKTLLKEAFHQMPLRWTSRSLFNFCVL